MEGNPLIHKETTERNEQFQQLDELDGFTKLSTKQQQMVRLSLYVQQRAVRGTDPGSQDNIGIGYETDDVFIDFPKGENREGVTIENKYRISQRHIYDWYCHATITALKHERVDKKLFYQTDVPELLNETGYEIKCEADIIDFIEIALVDSEMPVVLHVLGSQVPVLHSAIILGKDNGGTFILWEKKGFSLPYQLTTLENVFQDYSSHGQEWLVRPLENIPEENVE